MNFLDIFKKILQLIQQEFYLSQAINLRLELQILIEKLLKYRKIMGIQSIVQLSTRMVQLWKRK